jgi:hypothetical protein
MGEHKAYHPIESQDAKHLIGEDIVCANQKEGLGYWATLEGVNTLSDHPYICRLTYNNKISSFKWIATI